MEKYRQWADPGTGINPFVPERIVSSNIVLRFLKLIVGTVLVLVRLPVVAIAFIWIIIASFVSMLLPIAVLRRFWDRLTIPIGARLWLFGLGFFWIQADYADSRKLRLRIPPDDSRTSSPPGQRVGAGDLIVSNYTSVAEVLYLAFRFTPIFTVSVPDDDEPEEKGVVFRKSLLGAIRSAMGFNFPSSLGGTTISSLASSAHAPISVFPEGTRSNGKGVLKFAPVLKEAQRNNKRIPTTLVAFRYQFSHMSPTHTVGNGFWHMIKLCYQLYNTMYVTYLPAFEVASATAKSEDWKAYDDQLRTLLAGMIPRASKFALGVDDHAEFLDYWKKTQQSGYVKKTE